MPEPLRRQPEPEFMNGLDEVQAYVRADFSAVNQAFVERLLELTASMHHATALDLGTGPADIPWRLIEMRPHWRVIGLDASLAMLRHAKHRGESSPDGQRLCLLLADAKRTPVADGVIDILFSNGFVHHMADPAPFWAELRRIAKPNASVFVRDLARPATLAEAQQIVERYAGAESDLLREEFLRSLCAAFTPEEVRAQLHQADLDTLDVFTSSDRHWDVTGCLA